MGVNEEKIAFVIDIFRVTGEVDFLHQFQREIAQVVHRLPAVIGCRDEDIVDIEQQTAAGFAGDVTDEIGLAHGRLFEGHIGGRVFQQERTLEPVLNLADMRDNAIERFSIVGDRQKVVEIACVMARPGQVFGYHCRFVALDDAGKAFEMHRVNAAFGADRKADAVDREREFAPNGGKRAMGGAAAAHVVLGVNL